MLLLCVLLLSSVECDNFSATVVSWTGLLECTIGEAYEEEEEGAEKGAIEVEEEEEFGCGEGSWLQCGSREKGAELEECDEGVKSEVENAVVPEVFR